MPGALQVHSRAWLGEAGAVRARPRAWQENGRVGARARARVLSLDASAARTLACGLASRPLPLRRVLRRWLASGYCNNGADHAERRDRPRDPARARGGSSARPQGGGALRWRGRDEIGRAHV